MIPCQRRVLLWLLTKEAKPCEMRNFQVQVRLHLSATVLLIALNMHARVVFYFK
jgi:hypothetical protein